jgi:steroid 5-alpha reductase family enzyme
MLEVIATVLGATLSIMAMLWVRSLWTLNVTVVDVFFGPAFALQAGIAAVLHGGVSPRGMCLLTCVVLWSLRLAVHLGARSADAPEDSRYAAMRRDRTEGFALWSLFGVFGLQALIITFVAMPLTFGLTGGLEGDWTVLDAVGFVVCLGGLGFETEADRQLVAFRGEVGNRGKVLDTGLWRYTRHPNYFGEFCFWWGACLIASAGGAPIWTAAGPALLTFLLLRVSGVRLMEETITGRRKEYADYIARTSAFFPWFPRGG